MMRRAMRFRLGGTLADTVVPALAQNATYDANNRMTSVNGSATTYDSNGNTINDGTSAYTWDARNGLISLSGPATATFSYDALNRRTQRTVAGATTAYLYDGINFVQEQDASGTMSAVILAGSVDEFFARMTTSGVSTPLRDALGSTAAETSSAGLVTTSFAYEPYGRTALSGEITGNSQQYAGREVDATGLYFNRARYYNPVTARFISEDPIGFAGGVNKYAYVGDNPITLSDPTGKSGADCMKAFPKCDACTQAAAKCRDEHSDPVACLERGENPGISVTDHIWQTCVFSDSRCNGCFGALIGCGFSAYPSPGKYSPGKPE
jgi:RHS repeat-associated protein